MGEAKRPLVVIIGSGPSGLAAAIELGRRSIPCVVLERNARAGYAPRAKTTHTRTREHLRRWGIADKLAEASPFGINYPTNVLFVTRLGGHLIHRFENAMFGAPVKDERYSEHAQWIPQYKLEAVLKAYVETLPGVSIEYGQELVSFTQDSETVRLSVRDLATDVVREIVADYLIGADGARSSVREGIGATLVGNYGLSRNYNTIFRAPGLADAHTHGPGIMYIQLNGEVPSLIGPMDTPDLWYFMPTFVPEGRVFSDEETLDLIRRSTGIDLPYEILSSDEWIASRFLADKYRAGRVFLTGDACHLHPPFGGYGMNMGVADSVDLGWKIAAVLQGWGGEGLLNSYETERRMAHEYVLDESERNHALSPNTLVRDGIEDDSPAGDAVRAEVSELCRVSKRAEFYGLGVVLGYSYQGSPILIDDGSPTWERSIDYVPSAVPGCLAPHRWLADGRSLYDLFGEGFTLLAMETSTTGDIDDARMQAAEAGVPLTIAQVTDAGLAELYSTKLALIRPDQHVAWRGDRWPGAAIFSIVTGREAVHPREVRAA